MISFPAARSLSLAIRFRLGVAAVLLAAADCPAQNDGAAPAAEPAGDDLPLPVWTHEEWRRLAVEAAPPLLNDLLPGLGEGQDPSVPGAGPALIPRYPDGPPAVFGDSLESFRNGLSLFLPEGLMPPRREPDAPAANKPTPAIHLRDVTPEFLAAATDWPGNDPLIDPGAELPETQAEDLRRFLGYHAEESRIPIIVLLLARDEKLPDDAPLDRLAQGSLAARRAALLVYPLGEPWRARFFLPRDAHQTVSTTYLTRLMEACIAEAEAVSQPESQLHEFVVQLSIRVFWLQKELARSQPPGSTPAGDAPAQPLAEVGPQPNPPPATVPTPAPAAMAGPLANFDLGFDLVLPPASLATIAILLGVLLAIAGRRLVRGIKKTRKDRRHRQVWLLPEQDTEPRLGGAFCGGAGAWSNWKQ